MVMRFVPGFAATKPWIPPSSPYIFYSITQLLKTRERQMLYSFHFIHLLFFSFDITSTDITSTKPFWFS